MHDFESLYEWSIRDVELFWLRGSALRRHRHRPARSRRSRASACSSGATAWRRRIRCSDRNWFVGTRLNFAENLLRYRDDREAIVFWNERGAQRRLTYARTVRRGRARRRRHCARSASAPGDRVAGFMPNIPETVDRDARRDEHRRDLVVVLAGLRRQGRARPVRPDPAARAVLRRRRIATPAARSTASSAFARSPSGFRRSSTSSSCRTSGDDARRSSAIRGAHDVGRLRSRGGRRAGARRSSTCRSTIRCTSCTRRARRACRSAWCTAPAARCIQHLKELGAAHRRDARRSRVLLHDVRLDDVELARVEPVARRDDRACTTARRSFATGRSCGTWPRTSASRSSARARSGSRSPRRRAASERDARSARARRRFSRPAARSPTHSFDYVYEQVKRDVRLSSISGGTDIISCFAGGNPIGPVWRGELQARALGMKVEVFDEDGQSDRRRSRESSCARRRSRACRSRSGTIPTAPSTARRTSSSYPNVWRHGDWAEITSHDGMIIYGRSDATLNPGGVRIGTAEIYRQVEQLPESRRERRDRPGRSTATPASTSASCCSCGSPKAATLDDALRDKIRAQIRANTSPHHVPQEDHSGDATFRARSAERSPSSPCATSSTDGR